MKRPADLFGAIVLAFIGAAALLASAWYLAVLAQLLGWTTMTSWLLPVAVDLLAAYAVRCWLASGRPAPVRRFARGVAVAMLATSILGNAAAHVLLAWPQLLGDVARIVLTVGVGAVPPITLFVAVHLYAIGASPLPVRKSRIATGSGASKPEPPTPKPVISKPAKRLQVVTEFPSVMISRARELDSAHMTEHGRPITVEGLRKALSIGKPRAQKLSRLIREAA